MKFNFKWGDNNRQEMTPELVQYKVNTYTHPNVIKGAEHLGIKPCKVCGKEFSAVTGRQVYCSSECARVGQCQSSAAFYARKKRQQTTKTQTVATPSAKTDASTVPATTHAVPAGNVKAQDFWTKQANTIAKLIKAGMDEEFVAEYLQMVFGNK